MQGIRGGLSVSLLSVHEVPKEKPPYTHTLCFSVMRDVMQRKKKKNLRSRTKIAFGEKPAHNVQRHQNGCDFWIPGNLLEMLLLFESDRLELMAPLWCSLQVKGHFKQRCSDMSCLVLGEKKTKSHFKCVPAHRIEC